MGNDEELKYLDCLRWADDTLRTKTSSVADPDPGSGAFLTPSFRIRDPGSGIGFFPDPGSWIPDPKSIFLRAY